MIIHIKQHLLEEGVLQSVKDNWGKLLTAGVGVAAANAGVFGPEVKRTVEMGGQNLKTFIDRAKEGLDTMNKYYGKDTDGDGKKTLKEAISDKIPDQVKDKAEQFKEDYITDKDKEALENFNIKDATHNLKDKIVNKSKSMYDEHMTDKGKEKIQELKDKVEDKFNDLKTDSNEKTLDSVLSNLGDNNA